MTLLGAASDAAAGVLKGRATRGERGRSAVDAANYLVLVWMHCFGWRLYLGESQYGPEAGVGIFGLKYLAAVGGLRAIPPISDVPRELERLGRIVGDRGGEAEVERTAVSCVAALAEVYRLSREKEHPVVTARVRSVVEHVLSCADCRVRYGGEGAAGEDELLRPARPR